MQGSFNLTSRRRQRQRDRAWLRRLISVSVTSVICRRRQSALSFGLQWKRVHRDLRAGIVCAPRCLITSDWGTVLKTPERGWERGSWSRTCPTMDRWNKARRRRWEGRSLKLAPPLEGSEKRCFVRVGGRWWWLILRALSFYTPLHWLHTVFTYSIERCNGDKPPLMLIPAATMWKPLPHNVNQTPQLPFHVSSASSARWARAFLES